MYRKHPHAPEDPAEEGVLVVRHATQLQKHDVADHRHVGHQDSLHAQRAQDAGEKLLDLNNGGLRGGYGVIFGTSICVFACL